MLSVAMLLYLILERSRGRAVDVLTTFGRTPLFTYLLHIWVAHLLAVTVGLATGVPVAAFHNAIVDPSRLISAGWGFGLAGVYLATATVLILLYPAARWFEGVKRRRRSWWLSFL